MRHRILALPSLALSALALTTGLALASCGDDAAENQGASTITFTFIAANLNGDTIEDEQAIIPETFMDEVQAGLGRDLEGLELVSLKLAKIGLPAGVDGWSDLFEGDLRIYLVGDHGTTLLASESTAPAGFATLNLPIQVTREQLSQSEDMRSGHFSARLQAKGGKFPEESFSLSAELTLTFKGY